MIMRKIILAFLLTLGVAAAGVQRVQAAEEGTVSLRIAVVRIQDAFNEYNRTKEMKTGIEKDFKPDYDEIEKIKNEINKMKESLRSDRMTEPGSYAWFAKMQDIKTKEYYLKSKREEVNRRWNETMVTFYKAIYSDFQKAVNLYASNNGYDLVVRAAEEDLTHDSFVGIQNEITVKFLHYFSPALDRTKQIVAVMNRLYEESKAARR